MASRRQVRSSEVYVGLAFSVVTAPDMADVGWRPVLRDHRRIGKCRYSRSQSPGTAIALIYQSNEGQTERFFGLDSLKRYLAGA